MPSAARCGDPVRLTQKIALLVLLPLVAMTAFAGLAVAVALSDAARAGRLSTLVGLAHHCARLAQVLQAERAAAVSRLVVPGPTLTARSEAYLAAVAETDAVVAEFRAAYAATTVAAPAAERLAALHDQLGLLPSLRGQAQGGTAAASAVAFGYRIVIASTVDVREIVAQAGEAPAEVADAIRAAADLSRAAEALGQQQIAVLRALDAGRVTPTLATELTATRTGFTDAVVAFTTHAPRQWRAWWQHAVTGNDVLAAQQQQDAVARTVPGQAVRLDAAAWTTSLGTRMRLIHDVEASADASILAQVGALRRGAIREAGLVTLGVLAAVALAVVLAVRLGRPVVSDLRRLRDGARSVAYEQLPRLVARLNEPRGWPDLRPDEIVASAPTTGVAGRHEVGEVAAAFDDVYRAAVRAAAELARSRLGVAQMYVSLARRLQRRTSQMTARLDAAERDEHDEARLAWLFGLDHLVTLMGRTTDSLLVLGGQGPATVRAHQVALLDVARAAVSRIEAYARVVIGPIDPTLVVAGQVANELVLLLAELMDNATALSDEPVVVQANRLADRLVVQVIDVGIGIDSDRRAQLNERLVTPVVDSDAVSRMGLTVVGLLAAHYGLRVELRPNQPRGTIAEVTVPEALLRPSTMDGAAGRAARSTALPSAAARLAAAARPGALYGRPRNSRTEFVGVDQDGAVIMAGVEHAASSADARVPGAVYPGRATHDAGSATVPAWHDLVSSTPGSFPGTGAVPEPYPSTTNGLPVRDPHANPFAHRPAVPRRPVPPRDPGQVAAAVAAYARGVSMSRQRNRPPTTDRGK